LPSQAQQPSQLTLKQFISPQEFSAAGLDKLSPAEYKALEEWFSRHTMRIYRIAKGSATPTRGAARGYSGCEDGLSVRSVSRGGRIVTLTNGSVWEVDAVDAIDSALWLPMSEIVACSDKLINTDDNETVSARRIR
jgi:hypothetical protein